MNVDYIYKMNTFTNENVSVLMISGYIWHPRCGQSHDNLFLELDDFPFETCEARFGFPIILQCLCQYPV